MNVLEEKMVESVLSHSEDKNCWVDLDTIVQDTKLSKDEIENLLKTSSFFVQNKLGKLTTRELYRKKTPFMDKLLDALKNKID